MTALGLAHFSFLGLAPVALIELAARTGFSAVGLRLWPHAPGGPHYPLPRGTRAHREVAGALAATGVRLVDIETAVIDEDFDPEALAATLEDAAALGATRLSVAGDDAEEARLADRFAALCDLASGFGLAVDLECMAWRSVNSLSACRRVVERAGRPNGHVLIDALHLARCGGTPADVAALPAPLVGAAQFCDAPLAAPPTTEAIIAEARGNRLPPGQGELPLRDLARALPTGTAVSVEAPMPPANSPDTRAKAMLDGLRALFDKD